MSDPPRDETEAALKLQRDARLRARAQAAARAELAKLHHEEYAELYQKHKERLKGDS